MPTAETAMQSDPCATAVAANPWFSYRAIHDRTPFRWPNSARLAVYLGFNIEHFSWGNGLGACLGPGSPSPDVLNYMWREYGNRVGVWRCMDLFNTLELPVGALINTALYDHCPEVVRACGKYGYEIIAHGHSNAVRQGQMTAVDELRLLQECRQRIEAESGSAPQGWLSPWISESMQTPKLLAQAGYQYTLNWCHDDQPTLVSTGSAERLWSIPYPQEVNDIPMIIHRQMEGPAFAQLIMDHFDEMLEQVNRSAHAESLVMGIALHPYIVGQPHRLRHLRRALQHIAAHRNDIWLTTPGAICETMQALTP